MHGVGRPLATMRYGVFRAVILALVLGWCSGQALAQQRVALLIGNQAYRHERPLRNPVNDAELLGRVLKDDLKFDAVRVERNLDIDAMDRVLDEFATQAKGAATVVFYFSGHGLTSPDRRTFLMPTDARIGVPGARRLDRQAVAADAVRDKLRALGASVTLLILDACRDGPGEGKSGNKGLARIGGGNQLLVAYATEEGKVAADGTGANSPYAEALARAWQRPGLSVLQQLDAVHDEVASRIPGQQPTREGNLRADASLDSPFARVPPQERVRPDEEAWALCRGAVTTGPCQDYLDIWPQGRFVSVARTRLRELLALAQPGPVPLVPQPAASARTVGETFRDCADCPPLVVLPEGRFSMGSPVFERDRNLNEGPMHEVRIGYRLAVGKYEVSVSEFGHFVHATGYKTEAERGDGCVAWDGKAWTTIAERHWRNPGFSQDDSHPVVCVSWNDTQAYLKWLNGVMPGKGYRLLSEAEWEYAARAGQHGWRYPWGAEADREPCDTANVADIMARSQVPGSSGWTVASCSDGYAYTAPGDALRVNAFGLHHLHGNAWEWVEDEWHDSYNGAPRDGSAWTDGSQAARVMRGGSWRNTPRGLRLAHRAWGRQDARGNYVGFRVARTL